MRLVSDHKSVHSLKVDGGRAGFEVDFPCKIEIQAGNSDKNFNLIERYIAEKVARFDFGYPSGKTTYNGDNINF